MGSTALAPPQLADVTLALFGGAKTDIAPSDCPEGISPDTQDGVYLPGEWVSRPCLSRLFDAGLLTPGTEVLYEKTYIQPDNDPLTLVLTSDGKLWAEDVAETPLALASLFQVTPGLYAQSVTAFGREYIAFSDLLHGQGVPLQFDGTNLDRVTQDGPGASPTVADFQQSLAVQSTSPIIVQFNMLAAPNGATEAGNIATLTFPIPHTLVPGQRIVVNGVAVAGYNGVQTVETVPGAFQLTYRLAATGLAASGGGGAGAAVARVFTNLLTSGPPPQINIGDTVILTGTGSGLDNNTFNNPSNWQVVALNHAGVDWAIDISIATLSPTAVLATTAVAGNIALGGQSSPGAHQVVCMFLTRQGALTQPSPPLQFVSTGNTQWQITNLPIGPPNVVARVLGFTGAGGDNFFTIPASVNLPNPNSPTGTPVVISATVVPDNTSTTAILDVPDNTLFGAVAIDQIGNDLFDQRVLGPVLGFFAYASRLMCWGDYAKIENFLNMGFCGGYLSGVLTTPLGWTVATAGGILVEQNTTTTTAAIVAAGSQNVKVVATNGFVIGNTAIIGSGADREIVTVTAINDGGPLSPGIVATFTKTHANGSPFVPRFALGPWQAGMAWQITGDGTANPKGQITQPAYRDAFGTAILLPNTLYWARLWATNQGGVVAGSVYLDLYSASGGGVLAQAIIPVTDFSYLGNFAQAAFSAATPAVIPADTVLRIYEQGVPNGSVISICEAELVYAQNPYNNTLVRSSYVLNPEGIAQTTGNLGAADDDSAVACLALLRQSALLETLDGVHIFQDNDGEPDTWVINQLTRAVGAVSLRAGDPGKFGTGDAAEDWALVASQNGVYLFAGAEFWKVSQEISRGALPQAQDPRATWDDINWAAKKTIVAKNDPAKRRAYFAVPLNGALKPNYIFALDYREMDTATQIANAPPVHITIQGKMKSSDLTRKWSTWNISANDLEILVRPGNVRELYFAGGSRGGAAHGNVYSLDPAKLTDDDYGQIFPYYTTYAFTDHDQEQALNLGSDLHLYKKIHAFIAGVGLVTITPIVNSLYNFFPPLSQRQLVRDTDAGTFLRSDLEWTSVGLRGQRVFFRIAVQPLPGATDVQIRLQKFVVGMMKDPIATTRQSAV